MDQPLYTWFYLRGNVTLTISYTIRDYDSFEMPSGDPKNPQEGVTFARGTVEFAFHGDTGRRTGDGGCSQMDGGWLEDELELELPPFDGSGDWQSVKNILASVFFTKIYNEHHAVFAGWDIDVEKTGITDKAKIFLLCKVRVSDNDGWMCRAAFHVVIRGIRV